MKIALRLAAMMMNVRTMAPILIKTGRHATNGVNELRAVPQKNETEFSRLAQCRPPPAFG
jgi:hypothetical protein